jgi:hypothetical protein
LALTGGSFFFKNGTLSFAFAVKVATARAALSSSLPARSAQKPSMSIAAGLRAARSPSLSEDGSVTSEFCPAIGSPESRARVVCMSNDPAPPSKQKASRADPKTFKLGTSMAFSTPSVTAATSAEIAPETTAEPAAKTVAASTVEITSELGTQAKPAF